MVDEEILLANACRCCLLEDKDMVYVFDVLDEFEMQISDLIARNGAVTIMENDCYSKHICGNCLNDLAIAERFIIRCRKTHDLLLGLTKTRGRSDAISEKMSYVLMTEPLYIEQNTLPDEIIENYADIIHEPTAEPAEANNTGISDEEESLGEKQKENVADQLGIIITDEMVVDEGDSIIDEEAIEVDDAVYRLVQDGQCTVDAAQSDDFSADLIHYDEGLCDEEKIATTGSEDEFAATTTSKRMYDYRHKCVHCGASFVTTQNYARHLKKHKQFACHACLASFNSEKELHSHEQKCQQSATTLEVTTSKSTVEEIQQKFVVNITTANVSDDRKKALECSFCGKRWVSQSALAVHLRTHTGERPFGCNYCPKRFTTTAGLDLHERRHTGSKPYTCGVCGKGFTESSNMKVHMLQHTREKPHVCTVCNRAFARVFLLQLHQRTHTGEKPYECEVCGKAFSQQGDLTAHRRIHSGERPFVCKVCGKGFIKSTALTQHRKSHEKHLLMGGSTFAEEDGVHRLTELELKSS